MLRVPSPPNDEAKIRQYRIRNREVAAQKALDIVAQCAPGDSARPRQSQTQRLNYVKDSVQHSIQIRLKNLRNARSRRIVSSTMQDDDDADGDNDDDIDNVLDDDDEDDTNGLLENDIAMSEEDDEGEEEAAASNEDEDDDDDDAEEGNDNEEIEVAIADEPDDTASESNDDTDPTDADDILSTIAGSSSSKDIKKLWQSDQIALRAFDTIDDRKAAAEAIMALLKLKTDDGRIVQHLA